MEWADGTANALADDLAGWCYYRCLVCPNDWGHLLPMESDGVPLDQQTTVYVPALDAAHWVAYHADDPTECIAWAVEREIMPMLQTGKLAAIGRKDCTGELQTIPTPSWVDSWLFVLDPTGGKLRPEGHSAGGACWDRIKLQRDDVIRLWPPVRRSSEEPPANHCYRTGLPGKPSSIYLVEAELDQRVAAGAKWRSKQGCAEELASWLKAEHPHSPRATAKTIATRLGKKISTARK